MQEVTVKPRTYFRHYVTVDEAGKELLWHFGTRRKNISFGLFKVASTSTSTSTSTENQRTLPRSDAAATPPRRSSVAANPVLSISSSSSSAATTASPPTHIANPVKRAPSASFLTMGQITVRKRSASGATSASPEPPQSQQLQPRDPPADQPPSDLIELMPIAHYDSCKMTVKGSFLVTEPGTFVLVFDNSFSVNTSKRLFYFVALRDVNSTTGLPDRKLVEGWILKKGDRKIQGYLKRWMVIDPDGNFSYFKQPGAQPRAVVSLSACVIGLNQDGYLIDIDSGSAIYHLKAQTAQDFQMWVNTLQSHAPTSGTKPAIPLPSTPNRQDSNLSNFSNDSSVFGGNGGTGDELSDLEKKLLQHLNFLASHTAALKELAESKHGSPTLLDLSANIHQSLQATQTAFAQFSKSSQTTSSHLTTLLSHAESAFHLCLADNNRTRLQHGLPPANESAFRSLPSANKNGSILLEPRRIITDADSLRESMHSSIQFYDAVEYDSGDEDDEFVGEDEDVEVVDFGKGYGAMGVAVRDVEDTATANIQITAPAQVHIVPEEEDHYDNEDSHTVRSFPRSSQVSPATAEVITAEAGPTSIPPQQPVVRRRTLPAPPVSMENISIMSILRNNMGKDLSTIAMPIALNEPLNLLQKLAEELEYCELLDAAADTDDVVDRMVLISAFAVSGYASTVNRAGRKPFNPLLGETFECIRPDKGFKFVAEKVSHHPPVMACHAESEKYIFFQDNLVKSKFWGKSMELVPSGTVNVLLPGKKDHLQWSKVTTCMRNVFSGTRYLEHYGTMKITSVATGYTSTLVFKEAGYFSSAKNEVVGTVCDPSGKEVAWITGKWDDALYRFEKSSPNNLQVIWRATPRRALDMLPVVSVPEGRWICCRSSVFANVRERTTT